MSLIAELVDAALVWGFVGAVLWAILQGEREKL